MSVSFDGITPDNLPTNSRQVFDANYIVSRALTASASTVYSASLDMGDVVSGLPYATTETINALIVAPAVNATMAPDTRTFTYSIQDSADNSSFANIANLATTVQTGASSAGAAAVTTTHKLPPNTRRYIRLAVIGGASTGDASGVTAYLKIAF